MKDYLAAKLNYTKTILSVIGCLLIIYILSTILFFLFNAHTFPDIDKQIFLKIIILSLRYDFSAIAITNSLFLVTLLWPFYEIQKKWMYNLRFCVFFIPNLVAILFELSDWVYFPFNIKRSTADVLFMVGRKGDFLLLVPGFLKTYWYLIPIAMVYIALLIFTYKFAVKPIKSPFSRKKQIIPNIVADFLLIGITVIMIRGGLQLKPITTNTPLQQVENVNVPLVLNTPFSIINSIGKPSLTNFHFYPNQASLEKVFNPVKNYQQKDCPFNKKNVVVIIVESLSKEYTGLGREMSYTPFLDSLSNHCIRFNAAYANAYRSIDGLPAVLLSMPALMDEPYLNSEYAKNATDGLGKLLGNTGYYTSFFHGGTNGTMNLDELASIAGFKHYFGRTEYNNDQDFDGNWGIFDEPFLQFFLNKLNTQPQPFCSAIFTLSSHPPYTIPNRYKNQYNKCKLPIENTIQYTDMSLKRFFENAKNSCWYHNSIFVITADHAAVMASKKSYEEGVGKAEIPILMFDPETDTSADFNMITQQIDILPSVLDYLHYPKPFYTLGSSIFRKDQLTRFSISKQGNYYLFINNLNAYSVYNGKIIQIDPLKNRFVNPSTANDTTSNTWWQKFGEAFMQTYSNDILNNKTSILTH